MAQISTIIVNWNTRAMLKACLEALLVSAQGMDVDVWVVDNASQDGSPEMVKSDFPQVHLIENMENVGFARANNQAAKACQGEYLLLLNSDAFLDPGALKIMLEAMLDAPEVGVIACQLLNEDRSLQRSCYSFPTLATELWQTLWLDRAFPNSRVFGRYLMSYWPMNETRDVDVVMGACMLVRRSALDQPDLFDETFFMYSEEVDLCYRLKRGGWKVRYIPNARAVHLWGGSAKMVKVETLIRLYRSRVQFFRKHYGKAPAAMYKALLYLNSFSRSISGRLVYLVSKNADLRSKAEGYWQVFRTAHAF